MNSINRIFVEDITNPWENAGEVVKRKILAYDKNLMIVKVKFEKGAVGALHKHPHLQISYVESGRFEVEVEQEKKVLQAGDAFHVPPNAVHGVLCLEPGVLLDIFHPARQDFLTP